MGKLIAVGVGCFIAGAVSGVVGTSWYIRRNIKKATEETVKTVEDMLKGLDLPKK